MVDARREGESGREQALASLPAAIAAHRHVGPLHRQGPRDSIGLAGSKREHEVAGLEVRSAHHVDGAQSDTHGPAGVDAQEVLGGNLRLVTFPESQAPETESDLDPPGHKR